MACRQVRRQSNGIWKCLSGLNRTPCDLDLAARWQLASSDKSHATTIAMPGDVHSALQAGGVIADPYFGRNEDDVQWVAHKDWVLERTFDRCG